MEELGCLENKLKNKLEFVLGKRELMGLKLDLSKSKLSKINDLQKERGAFKEIDVYYLLINLRREVGLVTKVSSFESVAEYKGKSLTLCSNFQCY